MIDGNLKSCEEIKISSKDKYKGKNKDIIVILDCNSTFYFFSTQKQMQKFINLCYWAKNV